MGKNSDLNGRKIKPALDEPRASAVQVEAGEAIAENDLVVLRTRSGYRLKAFRVDATVSADVKGVLYVARHRAASGDILHVLPWKLVTGIDTSSYSNGDPVYAGTHGDYAAAPPSGAVANVLVGFVQESDATDGALLLAPQMQLVTEEVSGEYGTTPRLLHFEIADAGSDTVDFTAGFRVIDVWGIKAAGSSTGGSNDRIALQWTGGNTICTVEFDGIAADVRVGPNGDSLANRDITAGATLTLTANTGTTDSAGDVYILGYPIN